MLELQQWDYNVLRTYGGVVMMVDGQEIAEMEAGQPIGEMLYEYLDGLGRDGCCLLYTSDAADDNRLV